MSKCGEKCEVYSRVCGYFRPVSNWNKGKKEEFKERRHFKVEEPGSHWRAALTLDAAGPGYCESARRLPSPVGPGRGVINATGKKKRFAQHSGRADRLFFT